MSQPRTARPWRRPLALDRRTCDASGGSETGGFERLARHWLANRAVHQKVLLPKPDFDVGATVVFRVAEVARLCERRTADASHSSGRALDDSVVPVDHQIRRELLASHQVDPVAVGEVRAACTSLRHVVSRGQAEAQTGGEPVQAIVDAQARGAGDCRDPRSGHLFGEAVEAANVVLRCLITELQCSGHRLFTGERKTRRISERI